jgi:hypothetical protein
VEQSRITRNENKDFNWDGGANSHRLLAKIASSCTASDWVLMRGDVATRALCDSGCYILGIASISSISIEAPSQSARYEELKLEFSSLQARLDKLTALD